MVPHRLQGKIDGVDNGVLWPSGLEDVFMLAIRQHEV